MDYFGKKKQSTEQIAHCQVRPALHLLGQAFLPVVDTAPLYGCLGWRRFCLESSSGTLEIHGTRTTPKPGSEHSHTKFLLLYFLIAMALYLLNVCIITFFFPFLLIYS